MYLFFFVLDKREEHWAVEVTIAEICAILDTLAPLRLMEKWDNSGLLVGDVRTRCTGVLLSLDAHTASLDEAIALGCNALVVHHPVIFQPLKKIDTGCAEGRLLQKALANDIAILAWHTNFDSAASGVSDYLGKQLGLENRAPLVPAAEECDAGLGCIGCYNEALADTVFIERLLDILELPGVLTAGLLPRKIRTVALCGGSGSDFAQVARSRGADLYLSAEIKHHIALWAVENGFCVIDGTHYATEKPAIALLARRLQESIVEKGSDIPVITTKKEKAPFVFTTKEKI